MASNNVITGQMISYEFSAVLAHVLKLDEPPPVQVDMHNRLADDECIVRVKWSDQQRELRLSGRDFMLSMDNFSRTHVLPVVGQWTGRMDDEGFAIINPVHDSENPDA